MDVNAIARYDAWVATLAKRKSNQATSQATEGTRGRSNPVVAMEALLRPS